MNEALDDVNKQIIEHLQRDGRMSYATLAKTIGLSEAAVRQRVQRLLDGGLMQIVAVTDPLTLGFARQAMVGVNMIGNANFCKAALPLLRKAGQGAIVNVSSCYAVKGRKGMALYDANKAAIVAMTRTLAFEEAVNVTLGLPFVRTSPDHGTAFDIAGTGRANPASLVAALRLAARMADARAA